ncbi:MAG: TolC family protein [Bacteroidales bacterium]|nr:TolC family protein [Bacteroidales bacterium]MCF8345114.1 TolC family protein [Bacteroidales bacterium]MCF8351976.1 TolC family protein [Bacteroidales bacterium]MCF8377472.1 TolC family protein [Bacteroidales bacterium]MCF8401595.1 TolC family protein [Bacteroidales bacterium]
MKTLLLATGMLISCFATGQITKHTTLEECQENATANYPLQNKFGLLSEATELELEKLGKTYLPKLNLNGQATYQSEVTKVSIEIPNMDIPQPAKDQYKVSLDLNQMIYDGGLTATQKDLREYELSIENKKVEGRLYNVKQKVTDLYFNILLLKKNKEVLELSKETIEAKKKNLEAGVRHGAVLEKDLNVLRAELLKQEQNILELENGISTNLAVLSEFTGEEYDLKTTFMLPQPKVAYDADPSGRIDYQLLGLQQNRLMLNKELINEGRRPKLIGFAQAGYGRPGLDMLSDEFSSFYILGAKLSWNLWNWQEKELDLKMIDVQQNFIENQKEVFEKNLTIELKRAFRELDKYEKLIRTDDEIIRLREEIRQTASAQLNNGAITSSEYISEVNAETEAKLNKEVHKLQLIRAKYDYLSKKGDL